MKACEECGKTKPITDFYASNKRLCKPCHSANVREKEKARRKVSPESFLLINARSRAKKLGIPFDITVDDIHIPTHCPILQIKLDRDIGERASCPSLDRIVPSLGYVKGNVDVISFEANYLKNANTLDTVEKIRRYIKDHLWEARKRELGLASAKTQPSS